MPARALIEVDVRIAGLRNQIAHGDADAASIAQLEELLKKRGELVEKMVAERLSRVLPSVEQ